METPSAITHPLDKLIGDYINTSEHNDNLYQKMTNLTWSESVLAEHRRHVENNQLGFGDASFHAMWLRLLHAANRRFGTTRALEIGIYKGQVISLWALIAKTWGFPIHIYGISPLEGQPAPRSKTVAWLRRLFDRRFRDESLNGNFYPNADYNLAITNLFDHFSLNFSSIELHKGYSTDEAVTRRLANDTFHLLYIDGDHTYEGALHDFSVYGPKVVSGGWLVADDAGCALPGTQFWKGHPSVSRAAEILPSLGFRNVLNVGHNRIYERE
jgi:hypothetical protein